jgi:hypothetical protein
VGDLLPLTKAEIFLCVWMKKLIFIPGNPFYPVGWHLPEKDMKELASRIRKAGATPLPPPSCSASSISPAFACAANPAVDINRWLARMYSLGPPIMSDATD